MKIVFAYNGTETHFLRLFFRTFNEKVVRHICLENIHKYFENIEEKRFYEKRT